MKGNERKRKESKGKERNGKEPEDGSNTILRYAGNSLPVVGTARRPRTFKLSALPL